jgi:hypothetical protein
VLDSSHNQVSNLDSYGNRDPRKNGESADELAIKPGTGSGNTVVGARMWNNTDDGFDSWDFLSPIRIEDSVARGNGVNRWSFPAWAGDGNGFKLGRGDANHAVTNSIAFDNAVSGFIDNGNTASLRAGVQHRLGRRQQRIRLQPLHLDSQPEPVRQQRQRCQSRAVRRQRKLLEHPR